MVTWQLRAVGCEQRQLLWWALKGYPEETVEAENNRINKERYGLELRKAEIGNQIQQSHQAAISLPKLEGYLQRIRDRLTTLDFDMKCLALNMLDIKIFIDGQGVEITGYIPIEDADVVSTSS